MTVREEIELKMKELRNQMASVPQWKPPTSSEERSHQYRLYEIREYWRDKLQILDFIHRAVWGEGDEEAVEEQLEGGVSE